MKIITGPLIMVLALSCLQSGCGGASAETPIVGDYRANGYTEEVSQFAADLTWRISEDGTFDFFDPVTGDQAFGGVWKQSGAKVTFTIRTVNRRPEAEMPRTADTKTVMQYRLETSDGKVTLLPQDGPSLKLERLE